jgi:predicted tellurium resistance membrane protein TerC
MDLRATSSNRPRGDFATRQRIHGGSSDRRRQRRNATAAGFWVTVPLRPGAYATNVIRQTYDAVGARHGCEPAHGLQRKTFGQATLQIVVADFSMSLDNVLAIAGAARDHPLILAFGLLLSIGLMGVAANFIGRLIQNHRWIAYVGLAIILYVACEMIYRGAYELKPVIGVAGSIFQ